MNSNTRTGTRSRKRVVQGSSAAAWRQGSVQEFLGLTDEEAVLVRTKAALAASLQERRKARGWNQTVLAEALGSGQSRVAKMEAAHPSVSLDLLVKALLATGATMSDIGAVMATGDPSARGGIRDSRSKRARRGQRRMAAG